MSGENAAIKHNIFILTLSNMVLQAIGFLYRMMLTKLAGTEAMGLNSLIMQIYSIAVSITISGMNVAVVTLSARASQSGEAAIRRIVRLAAKTYVVIYAAMAIPVLLLRKSIAAHLIGDINLSTSIALVLLCIFLTGFENLFKSLHLGTNRAKTTALSEIIEQSARLVIVLLLLKSLSTGESTRAVTLIIAGMVLSEFFSIGILLTSYKKNYVRGNSIIEHKKDPSASRTYLLILAPAAFTAIASTVFESVASLLLPGRLEIAGYTRSMALAAIGTMNGIAVPLVTIPMCFVGAANNVILPKISESMSKGESAKLHRLVKKSLIAAGAVFVLVNAPLLPFLNRISMLCFGIVPTKGVFLLLTVKYGIIYYQITSVMIMNGMMMQNKILAHAVIGEIIQMLLIYLLCSNPFLHIYGYLAAMIIGEGLRLILNLSAIRIMLRKTAE